MAEKTSYIGVDLGGTNMRAGKVTDMELISLSEMPTPKNPRNRKETLDKLIELIASVMDETVKGIGIGVPSVVDRKKGIVYHVINIPYWDEVHLKEILQDQFGIPVFVDNDANCFALGEKYFGEGKEYENFVGLTIGTGLGGGIIQKGALLADSNCGSGEFGMLPYKEDVLEYYCSGSYFLNIWGVEGKEMYRRALDKDPQALEAYEELGTHLAAAVKMVILTVDPEMIVFGGSVASAHPLFEKSLHENLKDFAYPNSIKRLKIAYSTLQNSGILGAASLCYQ
ncbi:MAG: ROK family protein [Tannerellaceae bacterium]|nr:ROK family protein [Tannerellaceae bacterium]